MPKSREECFRILGLPLWASERDIKEAYKRKALELHPDKNPGDPEAAKERFQELQEAYSCLVREEEIEPKITFDMSWVLIMMEIERRKEMERRRREFETLLRCGFFYDDGDDFYLGREYGPFGRATPGSSRSQRNRWESNHYSNFERPTRSENTGSTERKSKYTSDHNISNNSSTFDSDWLPQQTQQTSTRSARQKKKKKNKKSEKRRQKKVKINVKEQLTGSRSESTAAQSHYSSDDESVTVESVDSNISDELNEEFVEGIPKCNPEKIENTNAEDVGNNLKTGNEFSFTKKCPQMTKKNESFEKEPKDPFINDIKENNFKINSKTGTSEGKKMKASEENDSREKKCTDSRKSLRDFRASKDPKEVLDEEVLESSNYQHSDKPKNKVKDSMMKTCNGDSRQNAKWFKKDSRNEENVTDEIDNEYFHKYQKENISKQENSAKEDDWSKWKFPDQKSSNATITEIGKEKKPNSSNKSKNSGKLVKNTNRERAGENATKLTNEERGGEKIRNFSNNERDGYEAKNSMGKINQELPEFYYKDIGTNSYQNGKTYPSHKDLEYEKIKESFGSYIDKHIDPTHTKRYKKLIDIARRDL